MPAEQCGHCGRAGPGEDWISLSVEAGPGMRSERAMSLVPTLTMGFLLCPDCWGSPWAEALRSIVGSSWARRVPVISRCLILCVRGGRRGLLAVVNQAEFRRTRCPRCWNVARVERLHDESRPGVKSLL